MVTTSVTRAVLRERNVDLGDHMPRSLDELDLSGFDLIVNMSGMKLPPGIGVPVEDWAVSDPYGSSESVYRKVCDDIESRVMRLILRIRTGKA
jgi:protein-tyrosine-phosphatase